MKLMQKVSELQYTRLPIEDFGKEATAIIERGADCLAAIERQPDGEVVKRGNRLVVRHVAHIATQRIPILPDAETLQAPGSAGPRQGRVGSEGTR